MTSSTPLSPNLDFPATKRILIIDVLRAFALFGIIINHVGASFLAGPPPGGNPNFNVFSPTDGAVSMASFVLTFGKFFTIFSFLFGLSFAIQLSSSENKKGSFAGRFLWRLIILFAIGYIHNLFFSGDILVIYALVGVFLLPARFLGNSILLALAVMLILNAPGLILDIMKVNAPPPSQAQIAAQIEGGKTFAKISQEQFNIKQTGSIGDVVAMNAIGGMIGKFFFQVISGRLWVTFGLFLLGMYAGRKKVFEYNASNLRFFKKLCIWSGIIAVVSTVLAMLYGNPFGGASNYKQILGNFSFSVHQASLSAFYLSGAVLIYWKTKAHRKLNFLAPVGQMGLTTYLMQSVFGLVIFYGFGLGMLGRLGVTASIGFGIGFFFLQILFANWWMSKYRYGLVEWVWRSLTYMKIQPMRKSKDHKDYDPVLQSIPLVEADVEPPASLLNPDEHTFRK